MAEKLCILRSRIALLLALTALFAAAPVVAQPAEDPATEPAPAAGQERIESMMVYFPDADTARVEAPAALRRKDPGPVTLSVLALIFGTAAYLRLRRRAAACPRCRERLSKLEPPPEEVGETGAAGPTAAWLAGAGRGTVACITCSEVSRRRFGAFLGSDARCPSCAAVTKISKLAILERPGYLLWGLVRVDEECASCDHRASRTCAAPPLEAPEAVRKLRTSTFF